MFRKIALVFNDKYIYPHFTTLKKSTTFSTTTKKVR